MHCHSKKFANFDFVEDTFARQFKKKTSFFLVLSSLNRTFAGRYQL